VARANAAYTAGAGYNDSCPISLCDFEEGEAVVRMPNGHLIASECYEQLLEVARRERKPPCDPFTRRELPPSTSAEEMRLFSTAPLQALRLERFFTQLPRGEAERAQVSAELSFDVSAHPDAKSKVARDMLTRLSGDTLAYATPPRPNESLTPVGN